VDVAGTDGLVVRWGMMLGEVVRKIGDPALPVNLELALRHPVTDPVETHVDGLGAALLDSVACDATGAFIVGDEGGGWLIVTQVSKCGADSAGFLAIVE